ncbi:MAG: stalk domain-containing protein [Syntrophomonas sp.]|nr:stalk domain-containing protein [Syntrophomonas sp.]
MKKRFIISLALLLTLVMVTPVFAAIQLDVNGRTYDAAGELNIQEGITSAPIDVLANTLGCTVSIDGDIITMQENENSLRMTIDSTTAIFNGQEKQSPRAPQRINDQIYVPIRFVYECFGASVAWKDTQEQVSVSYAETRNGMTAEELLTQASKKMLEANRYKMTMDSNSDIDTTSQENGKNPENMKMQMDSHSDCWLQTDPMLMYMKQNSNVKLLEGAGAEKSPQDIQMEMLFNGSEMYMTMPEFGWVKMNLPGINMQELMKQSNSQDPATAMKQMKDMGMSVSFANDQERNGQKYWVIDAAMGGDILKSDYFKQLTKTLAVPETDDMQKLFEGMDLDLSYSTWINQKTFYTDFMDLQSKIKMDMDSPDKEKPGHVKMDMDMNGTYTISDFGRTFQVPDVSKAVDFETVVNQKK